MSHSEPVPTKHYAKIAMRRLHLFRLSLPHMSFILRKLLQYFRGESFFRAIQRQYLCAGHSFLCFVWHQRGFSRDRRKATCGESWRDCPHWQHQHATERKKSSKSVVRKSAAAYWSLFIVLWEEEIKRKTEWSFQFGRQICRKLLLWSQKRFQK